MTSEQSYWKHKLETAYSSGNYSEDQFGSLKDEMTDYLPPDESDEVLSELDI